MLSNITVEGGPALQTILLGQPQFRRTLASPDLDQLRQRVLASYHLGPLSDEETRAYIEYRLNAVGWHDNPSLTDGAFTADPSLHRRHSAPHQPAVLARAAVWRAGGKPQHHRPDGG